MCTYCHQVILDCRVNSHPAKYIYKYIYTSVNPFIYMHGEKLVGPFQESVSLRTGIQALRF